MIGRSLRLFVVGALCVGCGRVEAPAGEAPAEEDAASAAFSPDIAGARATLANVVIPNLEASTGYAYPAGDNLARMSIVKRELLIAIDILSLPAPDPGRARATLRVAQPVLEASPGYQKILAAYPMTFASTKMGIAHSAMLFTIDKLTA